MEGHIDAGWARYKRDPEKAKKLLAEAGYPNGLTVKLFMTLGPWFLDKMIVWQSELKECGINLEMTQGDHTLYRKKIGEGANPIVMWGSRCPTAAFWLRDRYHTSSIIPAASNFSYYSNPEVDRLIELAEVSLDKKDRIEALAKAQRMIVDDLPAVGVIETWTPNLRPPGFSSDTRSKTISSGTRRWA
jgi:peptide/nickel transport system substrate-binding protein